MSDEEEATSECECEEDAEERVEGIMDATAVEEAGAVARERYCIVVGTWSVWV